MQFLKILVLDDEVSIANKLCHYLNKRKYKAFPAYNAEQALSVLQETPIDIAIVDVILPTGNGLALVNEMRKITPDIEIIIMSGHGTMDTVIDSMHQGAVDFVKKPFGFLDMQSSIERTNKYVELQNKLSSVVRKYSLISNHLEDRINKIFIGSSKNMKNVIEYATKIAHDPDANVLIIGENGTGKEIIARIIHYSSPRKNNPISTVNCSAIPETLLESEFFGHRKGAFTDAKENRKGFFELANGGSLFLDEIADMPLNLQAKLLRTLEEKKVKQVGGENEIEVDVRIISATNKNIKKLVNEQKFRIDLLHRINTFVINIPPLRERPEDIEPLTKHFIQYFAEKKKKNIPQINNKIISILKKYDFPGNVRELRNMVERAVILCKDHTLDIADFTMKLDQELSVNSPSLELNIEVKEIELIQKALQTTKYNQNQAAQLLGISRDALIRRMKKYKIKILKEINH